VGVKASNVEVVKVVKLEVDVDLAVAIARRDWREIKALLVNRLMRKGYPFFMAAIVANLLVWEAKLEAWRIVKEAMGEDIPELREKVAKYIVAFMLAERPKRVEVHDPSP